MAPISTRSRLLGGIVAGPLFLAASYAQAATRPGFDIARDAFSYLSLSDLGGIQIANFVVSGLLFVVGASGFRRALPTGPGSVWGPRLIATMGTAMIAGGVFVIDPAYGYPAGAPHDSPAELTWHGGLHAAAFGVSFLSWIAACFVFARRYAAQRRSGWAIYCTIVGLALIGPITTIAFPPGALLIYAAATLGWTWTSAITADALVHHRSRPRTGHAQPA